MLEEDGFVLKNMKISDSKLATLVFAKDDNEMREGLKSYGLQVEG